MADRRCCCQEGCWLFTDDFNRDDSTDPGTSWHEVVGNWGILGWSLVENYATGTSGTANSIIICTEQQPAAHAGEQYLVIKTIPQDGDFYYLYPCASSPTGIGSALVVEFECITAPSQWTVRCDGEESHYIGVTADIWGFVTLGACVDADAGMMKAWILQSAEQGLWNDSVVPGSGRYSGLGHNNTSHINVFDDYIVGELVSTDGTECNDCFCRCLEDAIPKRLTLTVTDTTGRAACASGYTCNMDWEWNAGAPRWKGSYTVVNGAYSQLFEWCLECGDFGDQDTSNPGQNFGLFLCSSTGCASTWPSGYLTVWEPLQGDGLTTCTPFRLVFGPMTASISDLTCWMCYPPGSGDASGEFYIEITL